MNGGGNIYMQTNGTHNYVLHYRRGVDGMPAEAEVARTGGAGSGDFKPISGPKSAPNAFEEAGRVILLPDRRFLFAANGVRQLGLESRCLRRRAQSLDSADAHNSARPSHSSPFHSLSDYIVLTV